MAIWDRAERLIGSHPSTHRRPVGEGSAHGHRAARPFPIAGPAVSRHLRVLREAGLVEESRTPEAAGTAVRAASAALSELARWLDGLAGSSQSRSSR